MLFIVLAEGTDAADERLITPQDHAAFPGGQQLRRVERADGQLSHAADRRAVHSDAQGLRAVFDDVNSVAFYGLDIGREPEHVRDDHRFGVAGENPRHCLRGKMKRDRLDVRQDRLRAGQAYRMPQRRAHVRRDHHLVAGADSQGHECQVERRRARTDSHALRLSGDFRHRLLEGFDLAALGDPPAAYDCGHSAGFWLAERRAGMGDKRLAHTWSAPILMKSRSGTNASAALTRPCTPRKWAEARANSRMLSPSTLVFRTCDAWPSGDRTLSSRSPSTPP